MSTVQPSLKFLIADRSRDSANIPLAFITYLPVEPTLGTAKADVSLQSGQSYGWSGTSLTANVHIGGGHKAVKPLPALTGEDSTVLTYPSSKET
ncbi:hypothetical protein J6590_009277 [Homalodisca vitripennis]|nr:hypothetical protein J6590_009277 [Homalodisca vitripennis]